jgi:hypothetical protein
MPGAFFLYNKSSGHIGCAIPETSVAYDVKMRLLSQERVPA